MSCLSTKNPAVRRFYFRTLAASFAYIVLTISIALCFFKFHPHGLLAYAVAVLPVVPILGNIIALGLYLIEDKDEVQRSLMVEVLLWGLGGVLVFTSAWGSLETFAHIRHFNPTYTYTLFWIFVGISLPFLMRKYR
jgi:hypothetical protein